MSAVLDLPRARTTSLNTVRKAVRLALEDESPVVLPSVSWATYDQFVRETTDRLRNPRFYYEKGSLLVMPVGPEHEYDNRLIASLAEILAEEFHINFCNLGSTTYQREDLERGFEPDSCFYFANEPKVRGLKRLDMTIHPAPDLVIEVDITSLSVARQSIFAAFGVPEIWRYDGLKMQFLKLTGKTYKPITHSLALPLVTAEKLTEFIAASATLPRLEWVSRVREWAREAISTARS